MKDNNCIVSFICPLSRTQKECVYFSKNKNNHYCKHGDVHSYSKSIICNSTLAQVNKMVLKLKELGLDIYGR
jgi:hypothetical protein